MEEKLDIITIGECLIELSANAKMVSAGCLSKYYGGDTLATAIAALRSGSKVGFITKVGNDPFKDYLLDSWKNEGLEISQVEISDDLNGIYIIGRPSVNEKEVVYYRKKTASSKLSIDDINPEYIKNSKILYTSGITQSLSAYSNEAVEFALKTAKENDVIVAYDPNYHPALMSSESLKENFLRISEYVDILFMSTKHDTKNLLDIESPENIIKKVWDMGIQTVILKSIENKGYYTGYKGNINFTNFYSDDYIDTTCSGDAFNGGYMHAIAHGFTTSEAVKFASIVAGLQAQGIGAIKSIPYKEDIYSIYRSNNV